MRSKVALVVIVVLTLGWVAAMACGNHCQGGPCHKGKNNGECAGLRAHCNLTEVQRQTVREKVREMRDAGASRDEIRSTVREMLRSYGIEIPKDAHCQRRSIMLKLNDEERQAIRDKVRQMRDAGASRQEIRTEVIEMMKGFGIDISLSSPAQTQNQSESITWGKMKSQYR